jgi:hypothetical protein
MSSMSENLRWKLIVGCLLLAVLEAPESVLVLAEDLRGPWRSGAAAVDPVATLSGAPAPADASPALKPLGADASVATEDVLVIDRNRSHRSARHTRSVLAAR